MDTESPSPSIVYLPVTQRGLTKKYILNAVFLVAGAVGASMLNSASQSFMPVPVPTKDAYELSLELREQFNRGEISRNYLEDEIRKLEGRSTDKRDSDLSEDDRKALSWALFGAAGLSGLISFINGFGFIDNRYYLSRRINAIDTAKGRITTTKFWFPYGTNSTDIPIDKITQVSATQTSLDRMLGTGRVEIQGVVYTAAGSKDIRHAIDYIEDPQGAKTKILEMLPEKAGLELKLRDGERSSPVQKTD